MFNAIKMKQLYSVLLFLLGATSIWAQPFRYSEKIFQETDTLKNVEYATADWLNNSFSLLADYNIHDGENKTEMRPVYMDIFTPKGDTLTKRPAIIFVHSGGFLMGSKKNDDMIAFCDSFARRGYVTAALGYRIGMGAEITTLWGFPLSIKLSEKNAARAVYRATQDSRAAIRFLKSKAGDYGIDTSKIYMVGSSAGGFVALHNLYMNQPHEIPELALTEPSLGNLDTVGIQGYGSQANAIVSMWGALEKPELIEDEKTPVFLVHGEDDDVVYFKKGMPLKTLVPVNDAIDFLIPETYGGFCIDTALINRNVEHETYFVPGKKHEFYGVATGMFGEDDPNQYWDTIQNKISNFLLDQFHPSANFNLTIDGLTVTLHNTSSDSFYTEWDLGNDSTATGSPITHSYSQPGEYKIQLTTYNENMAADTLTKSVLIIPVSAKTELEEQIKVYPNPVRDRIYINGISGNYNATVFDLSGRRRITVFNSQKSYIEVDQLKTGFYILEIEWKGRKIYHKILK